MSARLSCCAMLLAAVLAWPAAQAAQAEPQALADPTRPPPEALLATGAAAPAPAAPQLPVLQSVLTSNRPGGRRVAVIDGQTVRLGGKVNGAVLVRITETEVVLRRGAATQVLALFAKAAPEAAAAALAHGQAER